METEKLPESEEAGRSDAPVPSEIPVVEKGGDSLPGHGRSSPVIHFIWAVALVAIFAITAVWILPMVMVKNVASSGIDVVKTGIDALSMALKPSSEVNTIISHTIGSLSREKKLVVMTQNIDAEILREKPGRIFFDYIPTGTARVRVKALDNRVQFYIPLDELGLEKFQYDQSAGTLKIFAPAVKIDRNMVFVQNDPAKLFVEAKGSWLPLIGPNVEELRNEVMADLKNEVVRAANNDLLWQEADRQAHKALEDFFQLLKSSLKDNVRLQIFLP